MNTLCKMFFVILFMSINGSIFTLIWILMKKLCGKLLRTDIIYYMLKLVMISFFIPVIYIIFNFKAFNEHGSQNYLMFFTKSMRLIFLPALAIIFIMFLYEIYKCIKGINKISVIKEKRQDVDEHIFKIFDDVCDKIKIKRKFEIYKLPQTPSPFIYGYFNPIIYLTDDDIEEEDLRIALTHELFHYKKKDALWKAIANIVCCMHWFNPLSWYVREEYKIWAEAEVDYNCFKYGGFGIEEYFDGIIRMAQRVKNRFLNFLSFAGSRSQLYKRAVIMSKYSQNKIRPIALVLIALLAGFTTVFFICKTSDAAGYLFNHMFINTCVELKEEDIYYGDGYIEYTKKNYAIQSEDEMVIETFAQDDLDERDTAIFDVCLNKNESFKVNTIYLSNKDTVCLAIMTESEKSNFRIEIVEPDGIIRCIEAETVLSYMYEVKKEGNYDVYITNISDNTIKINGSILFETR